MKTATAVQENAEDILTEAQMIEGCAFAPRCPYAKKECQEQKPKLQEVGSGRWSACHRIKCICLEL